MHATEAPQETDIVISLNISQQFFKDNFLDSVREASQLSQFLFQAISDSQNHNQYLLFRGKDTEKIHLLFEQLLCEVYDPSMLHLEIKTQFIKLILFELICSFSVEANGITSNVQEQQLIIDILAYIDRHYSSVTLTSCAQHFGYNPSYFSTLIKKLTSQTFKQLVNQKKLEESLPSSFIATNRPTISLYMSALVTSILTTRYFKKNMELLLPITAWKRKTQHHCTNNRLVTN